MKYQYRIGALIALFFCSDAYAISQDDLVKAGIHKELAKLVDQGCPNDHCKRTAAFISWAESSGGHASKNAFGFTDGKYTTHKAAFDRWKRSYVKYWYKTKDPSHFYALKGQVPRTRYCMSEHSSNSKLGCPNGRKNAFYMYDKLKYAYLDGTKESRKDSIVRQRATAKEQATANPLQRPPKPKREIVTNAQNARLEKFLKTKF